MGSTVSACLCVATPEDGGLVEKPMEKFKMHTIDSIDVSPLPQLITARVSPSIETLSCPFTGKDCLHYHIIAEELVTVLGEDDGLATEKWVSRFQETSTVDFFLVDPQVPGVSVFVPGIALGIRKPGDLECKSIITTCDNLTSLIASTEEIPIGIRSIASKNRFNLYGHSSMFSLKKKVRKVMRYQIFSFLVDEQVAMLGIVSDGIGPAGEKMMTLSPFTKDTLTTDYFEQYKWNENDKISWAALTVGDPSILVTKDPKLFQGEHVDIPSYNHLSSSGSIITQI